MTGESHSSGYSKPENYWIKSSFKKNKDKGITVLLNIYPIEGRGKIVHGSKFLFSRKHKPGIKIKSRGEIVSPKTIKLVFPKNEKKNKNNFKLDLHSRSRQAQRRRGSFLGRWNRGSGSHRRKPYLPYQKNIQSPEECCFACLGKRGKTFSTKWKTKNGDWMQAYTVLVNQSKEEEKMKTF